MSIGNPRKFSLIEELEKLEPETARKTEIKEVARVYKNKKHRVEKELSFKTKKDKPKLA